MHACPHCGKPGISAWRKLCLGPAVPATCGACGRNIGVPFGSVVLVLPFVAAVIAAFFVPSWQWAAVLAGIGLAIMFVGWHFIPLQKR